MRTDADHPARVRDPAIELLLSHTATVTDEWCSRPRAPSTTACAHREHPPARATGSVRTSCEFATLTLARRGTPHERSTGDEAVGSAGRLGGGRGSDRV